MRVIRSVVTVALAGVLLLQAPSIVSGAATSAGAAASKPSTAPSATDQAIIRLIQCQEHLKKLYSSIQVYAADHNGNLPPDLGSLMSDPDLDLAIFVCPAAASALPDQWQKMTVAVRSKWVNDHTDYVYLGGKSKQDSFKPDAPLLYEKDDDHGTKGMNVLFGDGHVEFLKLDEVHKQWGAKAGAERVTTRVKPAPGQAPAVPMITMDQAKAILVHRDISTLKTALETFELDNNRYPTAKEGFDALVHKPAGNLPTWHAILEEVPKDPWGRPYVYTLVSVPNSNEQDFEITSCGPDGKPGTTDDVK